MAHETYTLGLDLGSISLKAALLDSAGSVVFSRWMRVAGAPREALSELLGEIGLKFSLAKIGAVGATGSGRELVLDAIEARPVNEITAQATACAVFHPEIRSIIEIGGQDSKLIILDANAGERATAAAKGSARPIAHFAMNELCAAGTGAFLDQQASRLGLSIEELASLSLKSTDPVPIAGRCAVFAKSDMTHHQQEGRTLPDIVAGLCEALARSYCSNMIRGRELPRPVSFQGGVAANEGLARAFKKILGLADGDLLVSRHFKVMGAIGAAIVASRSQTGDTMSPALERRTPSSGKTCAIAPLRAPTAKPIEPDFGALNIDGVYLGVDVGSVSVKIAAIGPDGLMHSDYRFSDGKPQQVLGEMLADEKLRRLSIRGSAVTGSGRNFISRLIGADFAVNEITAQARAAAFLLPGVDTVVEIGGQDAKFLRLDKTRASHFSMNRVCAAGTGAFLQEQAARLNVDLDGEFEREAFASACPAALGNRCTVFMESDLVAHQQQGSSRRDLCAGLASSVVANYMEKVAGGHQVGKRVLFLGGVSKNLAVVSALEERIGAVVATSTMGCISGAIGAAIVAFEERLAGRCRDSALSLSAASIKTEQFTCEDCPNRCRLTRTATKPHRTMGGRCGKWDDKAPRRAPSKGSLLAKRANLMEAAPPSTKAGNDPLARVGIPRALFAFDKLPEWRTFFCGIGCEVVVSPFSSDEMLSAGMKRIVVENCLPVKALAAHIDWLEKHGGVDFIFVPSLVSTGEDRHKKETVHCPYIQGAVQFAAAMAQVPLIAPVINWRLDPKDEERAMVESAAKLGVKAGAARKSWVSAREAGLAFRAGLSAIGDETLSKLKAGELPRAFVVMGKDYNVCDPRLNSRAAIMLEEMGETVLTQDMIADDSGSYSEAWRTMCWSHGKELLAAAEIAAKTPGLYPVFITSFGCGPDSFTIRAVRDIVGEKPMLLLEVDEHSSSVGMETRIEAFLDSLPEKAAVADDRRRRPFSPGSGIRSVYLPNFSDHGLAFAAAVKTLGFEPRLTELPDDESARLGAAHSTTGECHPYTLMLGDYLKVARGDGDLEGACYFMPESGACRVGLFGTQMRLVSEEIRSRLPVFTRIDELSASVASRSRRSTVKAMSTYWEIMRGMDFFLQLFYETRAREAIPGSADRAKDEARKAIWEGILKDRAHDGLREAKEIMVAVKTIKDKPLLKIGVTGDYYTRICDYANGDIFRDIERMGGVVMLAPTMSEFVKYDSNQKPMGMLRHKRPIDAMQALIMRGLVDMRERRVRRIFDDALDYDIPLDYGRAMKLISPYMDAKLPAGLSGSVAAIMEQIRAGADGILNLVTFHCSYGLVISAALSKIDRDHPAIPKLTLIFEGLKPTHNRTRLEAFMERVRESRRGKHV